MKWNRMIAWLFCCMLVLSVAPDTSVSAYSYYDEDDELDNEDEYDEDADESDDPAETVDDELDDEDGFTIYFDENGGDITSSFNEITVFSGKPYGTLPEAKRDGFKFLGWFTKTKGGTQVTEDMVCYLEDDQTLHAHWEATTGFVITYYMAGGVNHPDNPDEYKVTSKTITLKNPTKTDSTFGGWFSDKDYSKRLKEIPKGSSGNISVYAKWLSNPSFSKITTSKGKITLKWSNCNDALKYKVYQSTNAGGGYKVCATVNGTSTTIGNLTNNKTYYYKIAAVYSVFGKNVTTEQSAVVYITCGKSSSSSAKINTADTSTVPAGGYEESSTTAATGNSSSNMVFYYQYASWKFGYGQRQYACFCCSPAMVLHAMGYNCDPNSLYDVMGGVAFNSAKVQSRYKVRITKYDMKGKNASQREQAVYNYLLTRPQGVMLRQDGIHMVVAYLRDGKIVINDPAYKWGEGITIAKSQLKSYAKVDYIYTIDKK